MVDDPQQGDTSPDLLPHDYERYIPGMGGEIEAEHLHRYILAAQLAEGRRVLDLASGEGYGSRTLAAVARSVVGVDVAEIAVRHAQRAYAGTPNLEFRVGSCSAVPLSDASVDLVVSFETIEHHREHEQMMREIVRVLTPEGVLMISSPNRAVYSDARGHANPHHLKELDRGEFQALVCAHFPHVEIYGQSMIAGSVIRPLSGEPVDTLELLGGDHHPGRRWLPPVDDAVYFVAVCGRGRLLRLAPHSALFPVGALYEELRAATVAPSSPSDASGLSPPPEKVRSEVRGDRLWIEGAGDFAIRDGAVVGSLEIVDPEEDWSGWACEVAHWTPADSIVVLLGDGHGWRVHPHAARPDVAQAQGRLAAWMSGFRLTSTHRGEGSQTPLCAFGVAGRVAAPLGYVRP